MKNFRTLEIAKDFYKRSRNLKLNPLLRNQFDRAAASIALNLAEGSGKITPRDKRKFYTISLGSLRECQTILSLADISEFDKLTDILGAHLWKLIMSQNQKPGPKP